MLTGEFTSLPRQSMIGFNKTMKGSLPVPHLVSCFSLQPSADVQSSRSAATRIPVSKGLKPGGKAVLGVSTVTRLEPRAESQAMKIELRKPTVCSSASAAPAKS